LCDLRWEKLFRSERIFDYDGFERKLCSYLESEKVKKVAMESTSTYWVPIWDILWETGFELKLVNPFHIKQMPGRKSDAKDAQWIAELLHKNMLRGSLAPSPLIQELRTYTREYRTLNQISRKRNRKG
jgi:transposase